MICIAEPEPKEDQVSVPAGATVILYLHGNAETISQHHRRELYKIYQRCRCHVRVCLYLENRDSGGEMGSALLKHTWAYMDLDKRQVRLPRPRRRLPRLRRQQPRLAPLSNHSRLRRPGGLGSSFLTYSYTVLLLQLCTIMY